MQTLVSVFTILAPLSLLCDYAALLQTSTPPQMCMFPRGLLHSLKDDFRFRKGVWPCPVLVMLCVFFCASGLHFPASASHFDPFRQGYWSFTYSIDSLVFFKTVLKCPVEWGGIITFIMLLCTRSARPETCSRTLTPASRASPKPENYSHQPPLHGRTGPPPAVPPRI